MARLTFADHPGFHRAAAAIGGGAAAGALVTGAVSGEPALGALVGVATALAVVEQARPLVACAALAVAVGAVGFAALSPAALPLGLAAVLVLGAPRARVPLVAAVALAAAFAAAWAGQRADAAAALASWPAAVVDLTSGLFIGAVAAAARASRHAGLERDPVSAARRALPALTGEPAELVDRAMAIWSQRGALTGDDRALVVSGVTTVLAVAGRAQAAPVVARAAIDARIAELDGKLAGCADDEAAQQYRDARAALVEQATHADGVATARERLIARMHRCVATLETFRMACAHADASAAAREAADARSAVEGLAELSGAAAA